MARTLNVITDGSVSMAELFPSVPLYPWTGGGADVYPEPFWENWPAPETDADRLSKYVGGCLDFTSLAMTIGRAVPPRREVDRVFELSGEEGVTFHHSSREVTDEDVAVYREYADLRGSHEN